MKDFKGRKVLVSGVLSPFGGQVVQRLLELGSDVSIVLGGEKETGRATFTPDCPVFDIDSLCGGDQPAEFQDILFLNNPETLPNCRVDQPFIAGQLAGLKKLLGLAARHPSHFVYASSVAVYGKQRYLPIDEDHPLEPFLLYGAVKLAGEFFCLAAARENGFLYTIIRFGDLYGPGLRGVGAPAVLLESAIRGEPLVVRGRGKQVRSYLFIEDAVEATIKVLQGKTANQAINIAGNEFISTWSLAALIRQQYAAGSEIKTGKSILMDEIECCIDSRKAERLFGFRPGASLAQGLSATYGWMRKETRSKSIYWQEFC